MGLPPRISLSTAGATPQFPGGLILLLATPSVKPSGRRQHEWAQLGREANCVCKEDDKLVGGARDPSAVAAVLGEMLQSTHWRDRCSDVLCLGAGGAATAIALTLLTKQASHGPAASQPRRIVITDVAQDRLDTIESTLRRLSRS